MLFSVEKSISFLSKYQSNCLSLELVQKGSYVSFVKYVLIKKWEEVNSKPVGGRLLSYQRWALSPAVGLSLVAVIKTFVKMNAICKTPLTFRRRNFLLNFSTPCI